MESSINIDPSPIPGWGGHQQTSHFHSIYFKSFQFLSLAKPKYWWLTLSKENYRPLVVFFFDSVASFQLPSGSFGSFNFIRN